MVGRIDKIIIYMEEFTYQAYVFKKRKCFTKNQYTESKRENNV